MSRGTSFQNPDDAHAVTLIELRRWADAVPFLHRALAAQPDSVYIRIRLARCFYETDRYDEARQAAEAALALAPQNSSAHVLRGYALAAQRQFDEAAASFREAVRAQPDSAYSWQAFSLLSKRVEYRGELLAAAREAVRLDPTNPWAWFALGQAYGSFSDHAESAEAFRRFLALSPESSPGHNNLGWAMFNLGDLDAAESCFRQAIMLEPDHKNARYPLANLAFVIRSRGDVEASDGLLAQYRADEARWRRQAVESRPEDAVAHDSYACSLRKVGQIKAAWKELLSGLRRFPSSTDHWETLAIWAAGRGRFELSISAAKRVLELDPENARAMEHLVTAQALFGKVADAQEVAERLNGLAPRSREAERALGDACFAAGEWHVALEHFERAKELEPLDCCLIVRVGVAKARMGNREGAEAAWHERELRDTLGCGCAMLGVLAELIRKELPA